MDAGTEVEAYLVGQRIGEAFEPVLEGWFREHVVPAIEWALQQGYPKAKFLDDVVGAMREALDNFESAARAALSY